MIDLKAFHCQVVNDHKGIEKEAAAYKSIPPFKNVTASIVQRNYEQIKQDVQNIVETEMETILNDPGKKHLLIQR